LNGKTSRLETDNSKENWITDKLHHLKDYRKRQNQRKTKAETDCTSRKRKDKHDFLEMHQSPKTKWASEYKYCKNLNHIQAHKAM
jgi:hypothetical protein